jgi:hypothetical protein
MTVSLHGDVVGPVRKGACHKHGVAVKGPRKGDHDI